MIDPSGKNGASDETLVAFLDGELSPEERAALEGYLAADAGLRRRLDHLAGGGGGFAAAFETLYDRAPAERLAAMLEGVKTESEEKSGRRAARGWFRPGLIAAGIALFAIGGAAGYLASLTAGDPEREELADSGYWRSVVADYVALYTSETFAGIPDDDAMKVGALAAVGKKLGLDLTLDKVALPDLSLKGAIIFEFRGMPLAQIAYTSGQYGPVAFCIIVNGRPDEGMRFEQREGENIVYWTTGGRGYLVIGAPPRAELEKLAASLEGRLS